MTATITPSALQDLRQHVARIEGRAGRNATALPFGLAALDAHLPEGGLALGALHEVAGGGNGAVDGAAAALFAAGIAARTEGRVLWCMTRPDLFAPALAQAGLGPDRVIYVEAGDEKTLLACFEEGLRHGGLGAVVAETARLNMTASRRLQLATEASGTPGLVLRRWRRPSEAVDFGQPSAAHTRWRVSALPSPAAASNGKARSFTSSRTSWRDCVMNRRMERALAGLTAVSMRSRSGHGIFDSSGGRAFNLARYSSAPVSPAISIDRPQEPHMLGGCLAASAIGESWSIRLKFCCGAKHHNKSRDNKLVILTPEIRLSLH